VHLIFKVTFATMEVIITLIKKDFLVDFRQKYLLAGIALYVFATIYISYLAFNSVIAPAIWNALFWLILLFSSVTGMFKSFGQEANRTYYYYYLASANHILAAKLVYYLLYEFLLVILLGALFITFLGNPVEQPVLFLLNLLLGAIGLAVSFTLIASIASKSDNGNTLMSILAFPVIIPVLLLAVTNSRKIIFGASFQDISGNLLTLVCFNVIIIALSFILFPYSWKN
jgi:heme exporter protein B|tara:strand:+ start:7917 stop:8600 length:684 start_codon:yes stop_codon:yes gene_type:complete